MSEVTSLKEIRERDLKSSGEFGHSLPASPAVIGELCKDRRELLDHVVKLRDVLREAAKCIPQYMVIHDEIEDLLRW
jgi:hypothetical protein